MHLLSLNAGSAGIATKVDALAHTPGEVHHRFCRVTCLQIFIAAVKSEEYVSDIEPYRS